MNGKHRRAAAAALLAALLLGLSACADEAAGTPDDPQ